MTRNKWRRTDLNGEIAPDDWILLDPSGEPLARLQFKKTGGVVVSTIVAAEQQLYKRECRLVRVRAAVHRTPSFCHCRRVERLRYDRSAEDLADPPNMPFQRAISCEIRSEMETGEQYAIEQRVFTARVMHTWQCRLSALSDVEVACEVNSTARAGDVSAGTFVIAVNAALQQFAGFGHELLDE
jgi:hypothetical protein